MGCNPTEWNNVAAIGGNMMYPASPALHWTVIPDNNTGIYDTPRDYVPVCVCLCVYASINLNVVQPIPNIAHIASPNGAKPVKFVTTWRSNHRMPSGLNKLCTPYLFACKRQTHTQSVNIKYPRQKDNSQCQQEEHRCGMGHSPFISS